MPQRPTLSDDRMADDTVQHAPVADETVRMRTDGPAPDGGPQLPVDAADDTRPVTRDWLLGAPDADPVPKNPADTTTETEDDWSTQSFDRAMDDSSATLGPEDDETAALERRSSQPATTRPTPRTAPRRATSPPPGTDRRGGAGAPCSSPPAPSPSWPPPTASICWSPRATSRARPSSPAWTSGASRPQRPPSALEEKLAPRVQADHTVVADDVESVLSPATAGITLDVDGTVDAADDQPLNPWTRLVTLFSDREVDPVITGEETALDAQIETIAAQVDRAPVDATISIEGTTPTRHRPRGRPHARPRGLRRGHHRRPRLGWRPQHPDRAPGGGRDGPRRPRRGRARPRRDGHARAVGPGRHRAARTGRRPRCRSPPSPPP